MDMAAIDLQCCIRGIRPSLNKIFCLWTRLGASIARRGTVTSEVSLGPQFRQRIVVRETAVAQKLYG
jgi:hypothetical protein